MTPEKMVLSDDVDMILVWDVEVRLFIHVRHSGLSSSMGKPVTVTGYLSQAAKERAEKRLAEKSADIINMDRAKAALYRAITRLKVASK